MKGKVPRNSCVAQWRRIEVEENSCILIQSSHWVEFPIGLYSKVNVRIACKKNGMLDYSCIVFNIHSL